MTTLFADPALRFNVFDTIAGDLGLENYGAAKLPNGSLAFVNENGVLYRYERFSTVAANGDAVVVAAGGVGRWIMVTSSSGGVLSAMMRSGGTVTTAATVINTWIALGDGSYSLITNGTLFTVDSTTGVVTYTGPTANYHIHAAFTVSAATPVAIEAVVASSATGVLVGSTTNSSNRGRGFVADDNEPASIACYAFAQLVTGTTLRGALRNADGTIVLSTLNLQIAFFPAL